MAHNHQTEAVSEESEGHEKGKEFNMENMIFNHINNSNEFHLFGHVSIPLPCILYSKEDGLTMFMSSKMDHGHKAFNRYVMDEGIIKRLPADFPGGEVNIGHIEHEKVNGEEIAVLHHEGKEYQLEKASSMLAFTSFFDFSITKNVFSMLLAAALLLFIFLSVSKGYKNRGRKAPSGFHNLMEIMINFIIDEVAKPMLGDRYMKYLPFLITNFFFILTCNLMGLIPFFPFSANITGNLAITMGLAIVTFLITNLQGNGNYWKHIFWMPGVPVPMKIFLAPIEFLGIFIKPFSLMIRLFANITAGHIIIMSLVGLIFVFGNVGESIGGATAGAALAVPFTLFMNLIEFVVALIQAFIFTILSASYIGAATEEAHH
ncbi:MAG: F0F1 ATP synthase subunit A [Saprospiraceae bacterium]|nr:F0F1 ATP synthase subunit A [Saprospiraceae bacterium]